MRAKQLRQIAMLAYNCEMAFARTFSPSSVVEWNKLEITSIDNYIDKISLIIDNPSWSGEDVYKQMKSESVNVNMDDWKDLPREIKILYNLCVSGVRDFIKIFKVQL